MIILSTLLTIRTTNKIVFELSDEPYDLLIYTQTSKAMHEMNQEINKSYFIKEDLHKSALYIGGVLQLLFGVMGRQWENDDFTCWGT